MSTAKPSTIWTRKLDLLYLIFFIIHIPIMLGAKLPNRSLPSFSPIPSFLPP
jgi:hypothetical protein